VIEQIRIPMRRKYGAFDLINLDRLAIRWPKINVLTIVFAINATRSNGVLERKSFIIVKNVSMVIMIIDLILLTLYTKIIL
jgi:hypothetical protein